MRKFVKLVISFLIVLFILIFALIESSEYIVNKKSDFKLNTNPKYLVLGHSHPECAFNDSLIKDFKNLSQSGESYFYTYFKAKKVIKQNPSIKTVFIEFTNGQINQSMNNWIWGENYMNYRYPVYSPFMNLSDKIVLAKNNFPGYLNLTSLSFKKNFSRILEQDLNYSKSIGHYLYLKRDKTDSLLRKIKTTDQKTVPISEINLTYLSKLVRFCEEQGKKVYLIRSPQHKKYPGYSNESTYQQIKNTRYSSTEYLDFSEFPLNNSDFGDLEHLNYKGAKTFSIWFAQLLNTEFLEANNKQVYIDEEIKAIEKHIDLTEKEKSAPLKSENKKADNWRHPASFRFKNYTEYRITDTINIDLNGNGILERVYFDKKDCSKLVIEEKGKGLISIGCTKEDYNRLPNDIGWVNLWGVVSDKETYEIIVKDGELVDEKNVNLERPSIYIGKEESGGGIITYKNGELYWVHQSD